MSSEIAPIPLEDEGPYQPELDLFADPVPWDVTPLYSLYETPVSNGTTHHTQPVTHHRGKAALLAVAVAAGSMIPSHVHNAIYTPGVINTTVDSWLHPPPVVRTVEPGPSGIEEPHVDHFVLGVDSISTDESYEGLGISYLPEGAGTPIPRVGSTVLYSNAQELRIPGDDGTVMNTGIYVNQDKSGEVGLTIMRDEAGRDRQYVTWNTQPVEGYDTSVMIVGNTLFSVARLPEPAEVRSGSSTGGIQTGDGRVTKTMAVTFYDLQSPEE